MSIHNFNNNLNELYDISIKYKIDKNQNKIRIFGCEFVKNNKDISNIFYKNNYYTLSEYFEISNNKKEDILNIKLKGINNVTNMSYMFDGCEYLLSLSGISNFDTSNVTNIRDIF